MKKKNPNKNETKVVILVDRKGPGCEVLTPSTQMTRLHKQKADFIGYPQT